VTSYGSGMAQPPPTLEQLYAALHQTKAELMACRPGRIGSRWWDARVAKWQRLRSEINGMVKRRAASRRWWDPVP
jgi:hypothetical protein